MEYERFSNSHHDSVEEFFERYHAFARQPVVKSFFLNEENKQLLEKALVEKTEESQRRLDEKFRDFYRRAKMTKYFSNLIYFNSINFDKRTRTYYEKYLTILNQPLSDKETDSEDEWMDILSKETTDPVEEIVKDSEKLEDHIQDEKLYDAIQQLSKLQKEVLALIYVDQLKIKEVAAVRKTSSQNISKIHRQAITKLKKYFKER
ncbi:sigma factor-like helix-turn-helix DNA-binding protein [Sediminibacillus halophilus]|uniref:RNA polymerase sigma factor, sigma-70 family n=1 Tax=Sediminibacillus halophilus TaxID=482461 RepID=A0A1G9PCJ3_9BACI|nr:sigma-70 family RNA polymerase sigma factor [Sediminibacillus halophilus]SDL96478.1 RNA polymerase sigma factor, sigma-70 family [Sediminibacillus halophilus]